MVCKCILGWQSVTYHFQVTVTLTSDLVLRIIMDGAYLTFFEVGIPNLVVDASWVGNVSHPFSSHCDLDF